MKGKLSVFFFFLFCAAVLIFSPLKVYAQGQPIKYKLYIGYELPKDKNLALDVQTKEAEYLEDRNVANQACRPEEIISCKQNNEMAFREKMAAVPGVTFWLAFRNCPYGNCEQYVHPVYSLFPSEVTNPEMDLNLYQIPRSGVYQPTGLYVDENGSVLRDSDSSAVQWSSGPVMLIRDYYALVLASAAASGNTVSPSIAGLNSPYIFFALSKSVLADNISRKVTLNADGMGHLWTPLEYAARYGHTYMAGGLLNYGAYPSPAALYLASEYGHLNTIKVLLQHQSFHTKTNLGIALYIAADHGYWKITKFLIQQGAPLNFSISSAVSKNFPLPLYLPPHSTPFLAAVGRGYLKVVKQFVQAYKTQHFGKISHLINTSIKLSGLYPVYPLAAAVCDNLFFDDSAPFLIPEHETFAWKNRKVFFSSRRPLFNHSDVFQDSVNRLGVVKFLVAHHAWVNSPSGFPGASELNTPLSIAKLYHHERIVKFLTAHGGH